MGQISIDQLIMKIRDNEYVLPDFQRGFVWNKTKVKKLLDSLYNNYPTGTLLIWSTKQKVKLRGSKSSDSEVYTKLILDGQQRITSIYKILTGENPPFYEGKKLNFNLYFNIELGEFGYWQPIKMKEDPAWINVTEFFKMKDAGQYLAQMTMHQDEIKRKYFTENMQKALPILNKLARIQEYQYYLDEEKLKANMSIEQVVKIFNLVNKQGQPLKEADLAMAHLTRVVSGIKDEYRKLLKDLKEQGFEFKFDFLTNCLNAILTGKGNFDGIYSKDEEEILTAWDKTKKSITYLINILRTRAYIDTADRYELRTPYLLIPLVTYIAKNNFEFKDEKTLNEALYWMYNAMIWGRYTRGGASSPLKQDISTLTKTNEIRSLIENLQRKTRDFTVRTSELEDTPINSPFFNMAFIIAKSKGATDWFTGMKLNSNLAGKNYALHKHHIFPKDFLKKNGLTKTREQQRTANGLLNRAFLTQKANLTASNRNPEKYLKQVMERYPQALTQQFVPTNPDYWKVEHFNEFLKERAKIMAKEINKFLENLINTEIKPNYKEFIQEGEHEHQEFKQTFYYDIREEKPNKKLKFEVIKNIAAFLNTDSGTIFIGITDDGQIYGLEKDYEINFRKNKDGFLQDFRNTLEKYFDETTIRRYIHYKIENLDNKEVLIVNIEKARNPCFIKKDNKKILYIRKANKTYPMTDTEEIMEYAKENWEN